MIRPIRADDECMLETGLRHLSEGSVQRRFLAPKSGFTRAELRYLTEVDGRDHVALVAEYAGDPVRRLIAVARFVRLPDDPDSAEAAIVVADHWHRRGLGSLLAERLAAEARRAGIRRFTATTASDNVPAHRLMANFTPRLAERHTAAAYRRPCWTWPREAPRHRWRRPWRAARARRKLRHGPGLAGVKQLLELLLAHLRTCLL